MNDRKNDKERNKKIEKLNDYEWKQRPKPKGHKIKAERKKEIQFQRNKQRHKRKRTLTEKKDRRNLTKKARK